MTSLQLYTLGLAVQRLLREGRAVTPGGIRVALVAQRMPEDEAEPRAQQILDEARAAVAEAQ